MTVGPDGTVHVSWTWFRQTANGKFGGSPIYIASSRDGGASWSGPKLISDDVHPFNQGSNVAVAANGTIYVSYIASTVETGYDYSAVVLARSTDGGNKWTNVQGPKIFDGSSCYPRQLAGTGQGRQTLSGENMRIHSFPSMDVDRSTGRVHIVWTDNRLHPSCATPSASFDGALGNTQNRVYYSSTDDGTNFSPVTALTNAIEDNLFPAVAARGGKVMVGYYTRGYAKAAGGFGVGGRCAVRLVTVGEVGIPDGTQYAAIFGTGANQLTNACIDYAAKVSSNSGATFGSEIRLSSESSNPWVLFTGSFIGDYTGVTFDSLNRGLAVWTDFRGNPGTVAVPGKITPANQDAIVRVLD